MNNMFRFGFRKEDSDPDLLPPPLYPGLTDTGEVISRHDDTYTVLSLVGAAGTKEAGKTFYFARDSNNRLSRVFKAGDHDD